LISLVIPGNVLPITTPPYIHHRTPNPDGFLAKPCKLGYQSHFTVVNQRGVDKGTPITGSPTPNTPDELVVFEASQALPLFILYSKKSVN